MASDALLIVSTKIDAESPPSVGDACRVDMVDQTLLSQAKGLGVTERVELINELWASIDAEALPVSPDEATFIGRRLAEADAEPLVGRSWEAVEASLRNRIR